MGGEFLAMSGYFSPRWQQNESDYLESILYQYSVPQLTIAMQTWQRNHKTHIRTYDAIRRKCYLLGRQADLQEDRFSKVQLAKMLDVPVWKVTYWIDRGLVYTQKYRNREVSIKVADLRKWACQNPRYLHSIDPFLLSYFLPNGVEISQRSPFRRPVLCVDNGQRFDTIAAAASAIGVHKVTLMRAVKANRLCKGYRCQLL